jgi:hypothetical protein
VPTAAEARTPRRPSLPRFDPQAGLVLAFASVALLVGVGLALWIGWVALLVVLALMQVFLARAWIDYLEVPGALQVSLGVLAVAVAADAGVVVARLAVGTGDAADGLVQVAPALGVVFLVAVFAQLARRDEPRDGALAGLVAAGTGGLLVVGDIVWLPLQASAAGGRTVALGVAGCAAVGLVVGLAGWVRRTSVPGPAMLLPVLLGLVAGPCYVVARIFAG